ncbi:hypothetical protein RYX36_013467 [Vicia faba]
MWPEDIAMDVGKQFNIEKPGNDQGVLEEITIIEEPTIADFKRLMELTNFTEKGSSQLANLMKHWEYKQANVARLLREELDNLNKQRKDVELRKLEILEEHRFEEERYGGDKRPVSILDDVYDIWQQDQDIPCRKSDVVVENKRIEIDAEYDTVVYWKQRAAHLEKLLEASMMREESLEQKLQESIKNFERQSSPVEELSQILKRADNFLHFILQNAPVVIGHQDKELRYRFIYNHFPSLQEEDIIGKTDVEIFTGSGVRESQDFKMEVLEKGLPAKREITFETELFGSKTFLIYVEPVFSKTGETIGINYMGMDVTDQVRKRERMAKIREEIAVQKAKETELNKTIHITEETMRAKQVLATMSHEIRSPLSGVVSMAEILSTTKLDREQRQLLDVMLSSGDLVLQLINDILDLSKVESGWKSILVFRLIMISYCVVKHVLQTAAASLQKILTLEGHVADDVPIEVTGDVLRIRQILTNLISNAIKFTHEGKVGINLYCSMNGDKEDQHHSAETSVWIGCDVYDTGIGIPENAKHSLFKRYMQVSVDHTRKYGGTGLGLAICKQLVELMGGNLTVSSKEQHGSTFTFILPYKVSIACDSSDYSDEFSDMEHNETASDDTTTEGFFQFHTNRTHKLSPHKFSGFSESSFSFPAISNDIISKGTCSFDDSSSVVDASDMSESASSSSSKHHLYNTHAWFQNGSADSSQNMVVNTTTECVSRSSKSEVTKSISKPKILLVEDNKINIMVTQSMMKQLGHNIDVVTNGAEAVRAVQRCTYDLVLMDVCMPVMDGLQATKLIRSFEETGNWDAAKNAGIEQNLLDRDYESSVPSTKRTPIVAMTANALSESAEECFANGMDSFVSKPVSLQKLKECIEQYT